MRSERPEHRKELAADPQRALEQTGNRAAAFVHSPPVQTT